MSKSISPLLKNAVCSNKSMTRVFHPIGQGAFYSEHFYCGADNVFNMVYDCGTQTNQNNLSQIIKKTFPTINGKKQQINYLFVSHFHEDHINGIKMLLNQCDVENLVIPAIKIKEILLCDYIHNGVRCNNWDNDGNWLMERVLSEPDVRHLNHENQRISIVKYPGDSEHGSVLQTNNVIAIEKMGWEYLPHCSESGSWKTFIEKFEKTFPTVYPQFEEYGFFVIKDFFSKSPNDFNRLKQLYKEHYKRTQKNDNFYSMAILSKPAYSDDITDEMMCLYTGDYPARNKKCLKELKHYFANYWKNIKTLQAPHHGSWHDNPIELYDIPKRNCVISYGTNNTFHHPSEKTLLTLHFQSEVIVPINEQKTAYKQTFNW